MNRSRRLVAVTGAVVGATFLNASPASAHTGLPSSGIGDGLAHPVLGLDHLLVMMAVGLLSTVVGNRRSAYLLPLTFVAGMVLGGGLGMWGGEVPVVEIAIAASVVAAGVLVYRPTTLARWLPALTAVFGVMHGHAHGAEMPTGAVPVAYAGGFVLATIALHLSGACVGILVRDHVAIRRLAGVGVAAMGAMLIVS